MRWARPKGIVLRDVLVPNAGSSACDSLRWTSDTREPTRETWDRIYSWVTRAVASGEGLPGFFLGQVMKESGGKASPELVEELVDSKLS